MTTIPSIPPASDQATRLRHLFNAVEQQHAAPRKRAKVVTISSGKGGVGKTNLAVNLAIALQARGVRATVIDLDLGLANADLLCGLNPAARLDRAVAGGAGDAPLEELTVLAPGGFRLLPGSVGLTRGGGGEGSGGAAVLSRLSELDACTDVLLLDTGAGMGQIVRASLRAADLALLVATPEPTSIADAYALLKVTSVGAANGAVTAQFVPMLLLNQCASAAEAQEVHQRLLGVSKRFLGQEFPLLAAIPTDEALPRAVRARRPLLLSEPCSPAALAVTGAAESVAAKLGFQVENRGGLGVDELGRLTRLFRWRRAR